MKLLLDICVEFAQDLQTEFPGISGFSSARLWRMRLFYENYANHEKLAPLVREIGWTHNLVICSNTLVTSKKNVRILCPCLLLLIFVFSAKMNNINYLRTHINKRLKNKVSFTTCCTVQ